MNTETDGYKLSVNKFRKIPTIFTNSARSPFHGSIPFMYNYQDFFFLQCTFNSLKFAIHTVEMAELLLVNYSSHTIWALFWVIHM